MDVCILPDELRSRADSECCIALSGADVFIAAGSMTTAHLSGRIVPQSGSDLGSIGELFSVYLAGHNQTLLAKGDTVQPNASGPVGWLSTAFKTLELEVTLPGQKFDVIQSIQLNDLSVTLQEESQTWAPPSSSDNTLATYKNPFGYVFDANRTEQRGDFDI